MARINTSTPTNIAPHGDMDIDITSPHYCVDPMHEVCPEQPRDDGQVRDIAADARDDDEDGEQRSADEGDDRQIRNHLS